MSEMILMGHVLFGVGCILASVWVFVETLNVNEANIVRIRWMSRVAAVSMWLGFLLGGYWYVVDYPVDKAAILSGPWPFAHNVFMETKEHLVILLLMLATYLPIAAQNPIVVNKEARRLVLVVAAMAPMLGLMMEAEGGVIALGVKMALLARHS